MLRHYTGIRMLVAFVVVVALQCAGYGSSLLHTQTGWEPAIGTVGRFEPYAPLNPGQVDDQRDATYHAGDDVELGA